MMGENERELAFLAATAWHDLDCLRKTLQRMEEILSDSDTRREIIAGALRHRRGPRNSAEAGA